MSRLGNMWDDAPLPIFVCLHWAEQSWEMNLLLGKHLISKSNSRSQDLHKAAVGTILFYSKPNWIDSKEPIYQNTKVAINFHKHFSRVSLQSLFVSTNMIEIDINTATTTTRIVLQSQINDQWRRKVYFVSPQIFRWNTSQTSQSLLI